MSTIALSAIDAASKAFDLACDMEDEINTVRDLAGAVQMAAHGLHSDQASAICRLGMLLESQAKEVEKKRGEIFNMLHGFKYGWDGGTAEDQRNG